MDGHAGDEQPPDKRLLDVRAAARAAKLHYVQDDRPGIRREAVEGGFRYRTPKGEEVTDPDEIGRINKLAVPPAYTDVWICADPNGHLQASGRDARGRKQYRYHPRWREIRDEAKYGKMLIFGAQLPRIREQVDHDLGLPGMPKRKVIATIVRLLERSLARIGNEEYARTNNSFGLTTLRHRHVKVAGSRVTLDFRAKHGIQRHIELTDRRLAKIVKRLDDLPGQELFQFLDADGKQHGIGSDDVNAYLHEVTGQDITAKDFRTWAATNLAALALKEFEAFDNKAKAKKNVLRAIEAVAKMLGNTPAICRKCYIHPAIFEGYLDGSLVTGLADRAEEILTNTEASKGTLSAEEVAVTAFLERKLAAASPEAGAKRPSKRAPQKLKTTA